MAEMSNILKGVGGNVAQQVIDTAISVGKAALHCVMPNDIELYLCALELVDCKNTRMGYLSFSVMPEQISESFTPIQTMIKTHSGVVTTFNSSFSPIDIQIAGTFGRKFRLLLNYVDPDTQIKKGFMSQVSGGDFFSLNIRGTKDIYHNSMVIQDPPLYRWEDRVRFPVCAGTLSRSLQDSGQYRELLFYHSQEEEKHESWWKRVFHWHRRRAEELREEHEAKLAALLPKPNYTPSVNVESLDESQVTLIVRAWTEIANYWNVLYDVNEQIYKQLPQHGVNFPFPQMDVHVMN